MLLIKIQHTINTLYTMEAIVFLVTICTQQEFAISNSQGICQTTQNFEAAGVQDNYNQVQILEM